ncbi:MAG: hypothetical protein NW223_21060 [Hyphomicrobiaceae bacterium]|nr:hypothetical protein [Hyphomicrobiaceae bacterium]
MKTGTVLFLAAVMPFGCLLLLGMLMHRMYMAYRVRHAAFPARQPAQAISPIY